MADKVKTRVKNFPTHIPRRTTHSHSCKGGRVRGFCFFDMESTQENVVHRSSPRRLPQGQAPLSFTRTDDRDGCDRTLKRWNSFSKHGDRPLRRTWLQLLHHIRNSQRSTKFVLGLVVFNVWLYVSVSHEHGPESDYPLYFQTTLPIKFHHTPGELDTSAVRENEPATPVDPRKIQRAIQVSDDYLNFVEKLPLLTKITYPPHRKVPYRHFQSTYYNPIDPFPADGCELMGDWQVSHHPTCTLIHEMDLAQGPYCHRHFKNTAKQRTSYIVGGGAYRNAWMVREWNGTEVALKTLLYKKVQTDLRHYDRHRRDAIAMEQLTASPYVLNVYAHCGNSAVTEYANGGILHSIVKDKRKPRELLELSLHIATSVVHAHHYNEKGHATIAHTDLHSGNWVLINGKYKINDFNRARFLTWNKTKDEHCPFQVGNNVGEFRSPEEYNYEPETEKVDVYTLGNVLHGLLVQKWPGNGISRTEWIKGVARGDGPKLDETFRNSTDIRTRALVKAIDMALEVDPYKRASAKDITRVLKAALSEKARGKKNTK